MSLILESVRQDGAESVFPFTHHRIWHPIQDRNPNREFLSPVTSAQFRFVITRLAPGSCLSSPYSVRCNLVADGLTFGDRVLEQFCRVWPGRMTRIRCICDESVGAKEQSFSMPVEDGQGKPQQLPRGIALMQSETLALSVAETLGIEPLQFLPMASALQGYNSCFPAWETNCRLALRRFRQ